MAISFAVLLGMLAATLAPAVADEPGGGVGPCAVRDICIVITEPGGGPDPGGTSTPGGGSGGGVQMCSWNGKQWPCWDDSLGWFSTSDGCYYHQADHQPPAGDPAWGGHKPSEGAVYEVNCRGVDGQLTPKDPMFFAQPPGGPPPPDRPYDLGLKALKMITLAQPQLHAAPTGTAVVGVPVWLWYDRSDATTGPLTATAKGRQIGVTATVTLASVHWDTGDGSGVDCASAGTAYHPDAGGSPSPDCGHLYRAGSGRQQDGRYYLTATLDWKVTAVVNDTGEKVFTFDFPVTSDKPLPLRVGEVQVLN
ncbi:hypothetical protein [Kitasatospora sp. GP82]|uniref:hypothetical protein n=1 Tax=Kitasatospora sp. GP82 TaxID=3035089 RepID=UPI0024750F77|nr:hypothetical protein [Kitasatospora sp. GP82]